MKIVLTIGLLLIVVGIHFYTEIKGYVLKIDIGKGWINTQFNYQVKLLILSLLFIGIIFVLNKFQMKYFGLGNISAPSQPVKMLGIGEGSSWLKTGLELTLVISLVTGLFMYFTTKQSIDFSQYPKLLSAFFWILLFAALNAFSEELIFRLGLLNGIGNTLSTSVVIWISSVLFGLAHFGGNPGGVIGVLMAGLLGWVLAKSMYETHGFFWAWMIHFIQDVIIFSFVYLMYLSQ